MAYHLRMTVAQSILSLHAQRWSQRRIAAALGIDRATVSRHLRRAASSLPSDEGGISNAAIAPIDPARVADASNAASAERFLGRRRSPQMQPLRRPGPARHSGTTGIFRPSVGSRSRPPEPRRTVASLDRHAV